MKRATASTQWRSRGRADDPKYVAVPERLCGSSKAMNDMPVILAVAPFSWHPTERAPPAALQERPKSSGFKLRGRLGLSVSTFLRRKGSRADEGLGPW
jgi:hypothetical protein